MAIAAATAVPAQTGLRNNGWANRKGHCGREGRGDTLLNLTPEEASRICMDQCRAMCCRGPLILRLEPDEVAAFHCEAVHLGTTADISPAAAGAIRWASPRSSSLRYRLAWGWSCSTPSNPSSAYRRLVRNNRALRRYGSTAPVGPDLPTTTVLRISLQPWMPHLPHRCFTTSVATIARFILHLPVQV